MNILRILRHRLNTDGSGITTLIGLAGCPLKCKYCINKNIIASNEFTKYSIDDLIKEVMQDYCYFVATSGGVTFGGAEPLLQADELVEFMEKTNSLFATNIETSLSVATDIVTVATLAKELIIDIKSINNNIYNKYTSSDNDMLLSNLKLLCEKELQCKCTIKIPFIKGFTTLEDVEESKKYMLDLGFENIVTLDYIIRD